MRHFYLRLILGIIWLLAAAVSAVTANIPFVFLNTILGIFFLYSAYRIWKTEKKSRR